MIQLLSDWLGAAQGWLFETVIQPVLFYGGLGDITEEAFEGTEWLLIGLAELVLLFLVLRPMEALIPVHKFTDPRARWNDFLYTVLHRLGLFTVVIFFTLDPLMDHLNALLRLEDVRPFNLENLFPDMGPLWSFVLYLLVLDFVDYWYHRASHQFNWWWGLHSLHHSQMNMNLWSDDRNHVLDDLLRDVVMGLVAVAIGVPPAQYVLLVSPRYHRMHHAIGVGHESKGKGTLGGCNFAVLFPVWDILFRTANFTREFVQTGIRDQLPHTAPDGSVVPGREYGRGFWQQQWLGLKRMVQNFGKEPG